MESRNTSTTSPAADPPDRSDQDHFTGAVNPQDWVLLEALQQFIVPHVGAAAGQTGNNQNIWGPEAMKLLTALKEFISSVVRGSESDEETETAMEVSMDEEVHEFESAEDVDYYNNEELEASTLPDIFGIGRDIFYDYTFHENVLRQLREHVFNKMPIRLLRFRRQGSHIQIFLADKADIYAHLVSVMEEHMSDPDYQPMHVDWRIQPPIETDDEAASRLIEKHIGYAILSHTWLHASPGEVTYADWTSGTFDRHSAGYEKLVNFCDIAWENHGLTLGWMDTVCINKDSSSELDESIRSMYNWYKHSEVCIVYLANTQTISDIQCDPWFTRGWTLQELLAPLCLKFYNQEWDVIEDATGNDKGDLGSKEIRMQILRATTITDDELANIFCAPLSRRMQLATSRKVTREEDMAYSLMGLFNVSILTAYGEGAEKAFRRLLYEILNSTSYGVLDLFNWGGINSVLTISELLPPGPANYIHRSSNVSVSLHPLTPLAPLTFTHMGLCTPILLMPGVLVRDQEVHHTPKQDYSAQVVVSLRDWDDIFTANTLLLLDTKAFDAVEQPGGQVWPQAAVFNIQHGSRGIFIPQTCIAKLLGCYERPGEVTSVGNKYVYDTQKSLVFDMKYSRPNNPDDKDQVQDNNDDKPGFWIPEDELAAHGMQFISLYL